MKSKRVVYFDILNIIAIVAVIALHCNGIVHGSVNTKSWNSSLVVECLCYFAVPLFCMLSGANLMEYRKKYDTKTFFKKRFLKVLIPFLFWVCFMFVWKIYITHSLNNLNGGLDFINAFFNNKEESTYYFMFSILGIYLTMPILSLLAKEDNNKTLWFGVLLYFIFNAFLPNILGLFKISYNTGATVLLGGYTIYVLLGYLLKNTRIEKKYRILVYAGAIVGVLYRYLTTYILSKNANIAVKTTWGYTSWHAILLTCALFLIVKEIFSKRKISDKVSNLLSKISSCSFGIYLIHQIVMYYEKSLLSINTASWQWRTFGILTTYLISLVIVFILKKIPLVKKIVP